MYGLLKMERRPTSVIPRKIKINDIKTVVDERIAAVI